MSCILEWSTDNGGADLSDSYGLSPPTARPRRVSGYGDLALIAGLTTDGEEDHRRGLSRLLLVAAIERGLTVGVPARC